MFSDIRNRCNNKEDNPKLNNLKLNHRDSLMFSNHNIKHRFSIRRDISSPNNSILNLLAGGRKWNHNIKSLRENLNEGMKTIGGKRPTSLQIVTCDNISPQMEAEK